GSFLTAWLLLRKDFFPAKTEREALHLRTAGYFFGFYGLLAIFGMPGTFFPVDTLNKQQFQIIFSIPIELVRMICALSITIALSRSLTIFRQLEDKRFSDLFKEKSRALLISEERYRNLFYNSLEAIFIADAHLGVLLDVNPAACRLMAASREALLGVPITRLHPPEEEENYWSMFHHAISQGRYSYKNARIQRFDGVHVEVEISASLFTTDQRPMLLGIFLDVSERNRKEQELREKTDYLDNILRSSSNMAIVACSLELSIKYYNQAAEEMFGYPAHEVIGRGVHEYLEREDAQSKNFQEAITVLQQRGEYRFIMERPSGKVMRYFEVRLSGIWDHGQRLIGYLLLSQNITTRLQEEKELRLHRDHLDSLVQSRTRELETANRQLEAQHRELQLYGNIVSASSDHMSLINKNYIYQAVNNAYMTTHNKRRDEIVGRSVGDLLGENVFIHIKPMLDRCLLGEQVSYQAWFELGGCGRCWMDVTYTPFRDPKGDVEGIVVISRNHTDRKLAEEALQAMEQQFTLFMDNLPGIAFIKNSDGQYLYANPRFRELSRCQQLPLEEWHDQVCWPSSTTLSLRGNDQLVLHSRSAHQFVEVFDREGEENYWLIHRFPILSGDSVKIGGVGVNITEQIRAEQASREMAKFPDENPNAVLRIDNTGKVLYANRQGRLLLAHWQCRVGEVLNNRWSTTFERALLLRRIEEVEVSFGDKILALKIVPFVENGYVNLYGMEITELKHLLAVLEERRQQMETINASLEQRVMAEVENNRRKDFILMHQSRLAAMGEMIGAIAHQWRQPLNALSLLLANLEDADSHGQWSSDYLHQQVDKGSKILSRMSSTIDDFRNFFKPESKRELFNPLEPVKEAMELLEASMASKGIRLEMDVQAVDLGILGYPGEFSQVMLLILSNAKDAITHQRILPGRICISLCREEGQAVVAICDNGGGIPESYLHKIFDPYFTTKEDKGGSGIGLYMAKMIIEEHMHGEIRALNVKNGAEFQVRVPLQ
ncbi:MAG: PAS domain S-box protein, partial [Magnetococcales bacterium]|nr:PAS domain S-box protein [Magnetococcales bacterium]